MNENILGDANAKVVYAALKRMSEDRNVIQQAFQHWVSTQSGQPFDVIEAVSSIEKYLGLSTQERKTLMISMHAAANRAAHELSVIPDYVLQDGAPATAAPSAPEPAPKAASKSPVIELTEAYVGLVLKGVLRANASGYRELVEVIEKENLPGLKKDISQAFRATATNGLDLPKSANESACQDLCHEFCMLVSEIIGPIDADVVSNNAVSALLDMEAATRFDPRDLL